MRECWNVCLMFFKVLYIYIFLLFVREVWRLVVWCDLVVVNFCLIYWFCKGVLRWYRCCCVGLCCYYIGDVFLEYVWKLCGSYIEVFDVVFDFLYLVGYLCFVLILFYRNRYFCIRFFWVYLVFFGWIIFVFFFFSCLLLFFYGLCLILFVINFLYWFYE